MSEYVICYIAKQNPIAMTDIERTAEETRDFILDTAETHLRRYGYGRTTVVEIARACGMSHSNVYRFFATKADIIDAVIKRGLVQIEQALKKAIAQPKSAATRLETFILELHRLKKSSLTDDPELFKTMSIILQALQSLLVGILSDGVQTGEFQIADTQKAAIAIWNATLKFHHPLLVAEALAEPTEEQAQMVLKLLIRSLALGEV
jgi:AcrR family transcriptional regulator